MLREPFEVENLCAHGLQSGEQASLPASRRAAQHLVAKLAWKRLELFADPRAVRLPASRQAIHAKADGGERIDPLAGHENVEVVRTDILRFNVRSAFPNGNEIVAGNIPYNLTGALIRKLLEEPPRPRRLSLVVQKEVAERWTASTGASLSTVAVQVFAEAQIVFTIPASAFTPAPKVDSAVVLLDVRGRPAVNVPDLRDFFRFVEVMFQSRRKQIGGTLGRISRQGSTESGARLRKAGIDPARRPQTLSLGEWEIIYQEFRGPDG